MTDDPIVAEIRRARAKMLAECGGDLEQLMDRLAERENEDRSRLVASPAELRKKIMPLAS